MKIFSIDKTGLIFAIIISVMMTGCYCDFDPDLESTPVVCLNAKIIAGKPIKAEVTRTWRYSEGDPLDGHLNIYLNDSDVSLYVNGKFEEKMKFASDTVYHEVYRYFNANYIPKTGDSIRIVAQNKTYGIAEAEVTVPEAIAIDNVETLVTKESATYDEATDTYQSSFDLTVNVSFTDPVDSSNYYLFDINNQQRIDNPNDHSTLLDYYPDDKDISEYVFITPDYSREPLFSEHISPIETIISDGYGLFTVFSDRQISGRTYRLHVPSKVYYSWENNTHKDADHIGTIVVRLYHISPAYYNFMLSLWAATEGISGALGDVGLGDPVWEYSNVSTGAGIVSAGAFSEVEINVYDLLKQNKPQTKISSY